MSNKIPAAGSACEEASPLSRETFIPCGSPATAIVTFPAHNEGPYNMCAPCADHNVRNRRAIYVRDAEQEESKKS